jgi:hypothetical protein
MDSLDAQCLLIQVTMGEQRPPDLWRHERSGELSCAYEDGTTTFSWPASDVAKLARTWRDRGPSPMSHRRWTCGTHTSVCRP